MLINVCIPIRYNINLKYTVYQEIFFEMDFANNREKNRNSKNMKINHNGRKVTKCAIM